jgi:hypothetical protein
MPVYIDRVREQSETFEWVELYSFGREVVAKLVHQTLKNGEDYVFLDFREHTGIFQGDLLHLRSVVNAAIRLSEQPEWWKNHDKLEIIPTMEL